MRRNTYIVTAFEMNAIISNAIGMNVFGMNAFTTHAHAAEPSGTQNTICHRATSFQIYYAHFLSIPNAQADPTGASGSRHQDLENMMKMIIPWNAF